MRFSWSIWLRRNSLATKPHCWFIIWFFRMVWWLCFLCLNSSSVRIEKSALFRFQTVFGTSNSILGSLIWIVSQRVWHRLARSVFAMNPIQFCTGKIYSATFLRWWRVRMEQWMLKRPWKWGTNRTSLTMNSNRNDLEYGQFARSIIHEWGDNAALLQSMRIRHQSLWVGCGVTLQSESLRIQQVFVSLHSFQLHTTCSASSWSGWCVWVYLYDSERIWGGGEECFGWSAEWNAVWSLLFSEQLVVSGAVCEVCASGSDGLEDTCGNTALLCEGVVWEKEWRKQVLEGWIHRYQWLFRWLLLFGEYRGVRTSEESVYFCD